MYPTVGVGPNKMTSGNRLVSTMAFILCSRETLREEGRGAAVSHPQSQSVVQRWQVTGPSEYRTSAECSPSASCHRGHLIQDG